MNKRDCAGTARVRREAWRRFFREFVFFSAFFALIAFWWTLPHMGINFCARTGFITEAGFIEEIRPNLHKIVEEDVKRDIQRGDFPEDMTLVSSLSIADQALDLFKQCVAERGLRYCRYAGPDDDESIVGGRTDFGQNAIEREDDYKYKFIKKNINYGITIIPSDVGDSHMSIYMKIKNKKFYIASASICTPGCQCNLSYVR